jgi:hypothetical protein
VHKIETAQPITPERHSIVVDGGALDRYFAHDLARKPVCLSDHALAAAADEAGKNAGREEEILSCR